MEHILVQLLLQKKTSIENIEHSEPMDIEDSSFSLEDMELDMSENEIFEERSKLMDDKII